MCIRVFVYSLVFARHRGGGRPRGLGVDQGETRVFASVSPLNAPSLAVVRKLGFVQTGVQVDEIDGVELVFEVTDPTKP